MASLGVALLVFNNMTKPEYLKRKRLSLRILSNGKRKNSEKDFRAAVSTLIWTINCRLFESVSFLILAYTWVIFLIAAALEAFITLMISMRSGKRMKMFQITALVILGIIIVLSGFLYRWTSWLYRFDFFKYTSSSVLIFDEMYDGSEMKDIDTKLKVQMLAYEI